jgi:hypothetical protein
MKDSDAETETDTVPEWSDPYLDRVSDRLLFNYDLEKDVSIAGERFDLYGELDVHSQKQFFHPALSYGHHEMVEHVFAHRDRSVSVSGLEALVSLGHELADLWIAPDDTHFSTEFSFVVLANSIPEGVREFVSGFSDRTLLKYGYHGHYEINLVVLVPDRKECVASSNADVATAFVLWEDIAETKPGVTVRLLRWVFG